MILNIGLLVFINWFQLAQSLCDYKDCSCESDSGFDYVTCKFYSQDKRVQNETRSFVTIDTLTLKFFNNIWIDDLFKDLNVNILFLDDSEIETLDPRLFNGIQSIKNVYLSNNRIKTVNFKDADENFKNSIESLVLKNNSLTLIPDLSELSSLNYIDLSHNKISSLHELGSCESPLDTIDLTGNLIENLETELFSSKVKESLTQMVLDSNKIQFLDKFDSFPELNHLQLSSNRLNKLLNSTFKNIPKLSHLDLSKNLIEQIETNAFESLNDLNLLDLSFNKISHLDTTIFKNLKKLEKFFVQSNNIKHLEFSMFNNIKSLYVLDMSMNNIERIFFQDSSVYSNLQLLRLSDNKLTSLEYDTLFTITPNIKMLYLENNYLDKIPSNFGNLIKLEMSNQNGRLTQLSNYAITRSNTNILLRLNLSDNLSLKLSNRTFCTKSREKDTNYFMDLIISGETLSRVDKCVLKQLYLTHRRVRIFLSPEQFSNNYYEMICDCNYRLFLAHYSILIKDVCPRFKINCSNAQFNDDCATKQQYTCF